VRCPRILHANCSTQSGVAIQTYDNGDVVNWNQPTVAGQPEPGHPTPHLELAATSTDDAAPVAATPPATAAPASLDGTARWLGGIGVVVAALALGFSVGAFVRHSLAAGGTIGKPATQGVSA
jgi:hypothetical protein